MPTTTSPLTPATHGLRVAASFNPFYDWSKGDALVWLFTAMSESELAVVAPQTFQAPILIERAGPSTRKKFFEFFTVPIRNAHTRAAYAAGVLHLIGTALMGSWEQRNQKER